MLSNVRLLKELPSYDDVSIVKNKTAFSGYAQSYKVEIVDKKDVIIQLKGSEMVIKDLFKDLLVEMKGFKYQLTLNILLRKQKSSNEIEYRSIYFNSLTETVIGNNYFLEDCFNEIIFKVENWISHGKGWNVEETIS